MKWDAHSSPVGTLRDWIDHRAEADPDGTAYLFTDGAQPLSWAELRNAAKGVASQLTALGTDKGESVALMMPNGRDAVMAFFGAVYGGFRATMINLAAGDTAISYALEHSQARFVFVGDDARTQFDGIRLDLSVLKPEPNSASADLHPVCANDHALLMYTSGTTGRPKGVVHSQKSLLAGGWTTAVAHQLSNADRGFCVLPMYHINGLCVTVIGTLIAGGSLVMAPRFSASRFWQQAHENQITWFSVVPTIISHLVHGSTDPDAETKRRIRFGRSASAALSPDVQNSFEDRFGMPIVETMGLTETAAQILSNPMPPAPRKVGSPGISFGNEVSILRGDGGLADFEEAGEIAIRGPNVMVEYLHNPQATAETFTDDGWMRTGDLGRMDHDGYVFVTGRLKELIIKGGENIAPREIDEVLYSSADVVEAAAFARPCKTYGERVEAAVSLAENSASSVADLLSLCHQRLGKFKSPDQIHILPELPKGPSGKIQRLQLVKIFE